MIKAQHTVSSDPIQGNYPMHIHSHSYELFCFLSGDAGYSVEGNCYQLAHGDLMLMRKCEAHHLILHSNARYERMIVNFDLPVPDLFDPTGQLMAPFHDRPLGKFNHYPASLFPDNQWQFYLEKIYQCKQPLQQLYYLLPLLNDLTVCFETVKNSNIHGEKDPAASVIKYINRHIQDDLSLEVLSQHFYLSKTHLNRIFKRSTGTTIWNYITVKRLFLARELLASGISPTQVYAQCGFQDYTTFYRAYKQHFGFSPKNDSTQKLEQQSADTT